MYTCGNGAKRDSVSDWTGSPSPCFRGRNANMCLLNREVDYYSCDMCREVANLRRHFIAVCINDVGWAPTQWTLYTEIEWGLDKCSDVELSQNFKYVPSWQVVVAEKHVRWSHKVFFGDECFKGAWNETVFSDDVFASSSTGVYLKIHTYMTVFLCSKSAKLRLCSRLSCIVTMVVIQLLNGQKES